MVVGKDSRTYPATARKNTHAGCSGASKTAMSIASVVCTDRLCGQICGKYTVYSNTTTYFSSLTFFSFLGDVFYVSCRFSAFPLPPSASNRRKHDTAKLPYFERTTCNGVVYGNIASAYKNCRFCELSLR